MKRQEITKTRCSFQMTPASLRLDNPFRNLQYSIFNLVRNWQAPASLRG